MATAVVGKQTCDQIALETMRRMPNVVFDEQTKILKCIVNTNARCLFVFLNTTVKFAETKQCVFCCCSIVAQATLCVLAEEKIEDYFSVAKTTYELNHDICCEIVGLCDACVTQSAAIFYVESPRNQNFVCCSSQEQNISDVCRRKLEQLRKDFFASKKCCVCFASPKNLAEIMQNVEKICVLTEEKYENTTVVSALHALDIFFVDTDNEKMAFDLLYDCVAQAAFEFYKLKRYEESPDVVVHANQLYTEALRFQCSDLLLQRKPFYCSQACMTTFRSICSLLLTNSMWKVSFDEFIAAVSLSTNPQKPSMISKNPPAGRARQFFRSSANFLAAFVEHHLQTLFNCPSIKLHDNKCFLYD